MLTKTTPTDIRYEYMHIDMTNIFLNLFAKLISFTCFCQFSHIVTLFFGGRKILIDFDSYHQRKRNLRQMMIMIGGCRK
jgi:hypothetical protein